LRWWPPRFRRSAPVTIPDGCMAASSGGETPVTGILFRKQRFD
jgi:hypothetical protein